MTSISGGNPDVDVVGVGVAAVVVAAVAVVDAVASLCGICAFVGVTLPIGSAGHRNTSISPFDDLM